MESDQIKAIEARRSEIAKSIDSLQKEEDELAVTLRVLRRFSPTNRADAAIAYKLGPPRPEGTPTTFEMTERVLIEAEKAGRDGLTGAEIVEEIGRLFWPGLTGAQILPSIYGFKVQGRRHKTPSGKFKRIKTNKEGPES